MGIVWLPGGYLGLVSACLKGPLEPSPEGLVFDMALGTILCSREACLEQWLVWLAS